MGSAEAKKGTYPKVGPTGPGDLNLEGDWEGPIELFEFSIIFIVI